MRGGGQLAKRGIRKRTGEAGCCAGLVDLGRVLDVLGAAGVVERREGLLDVARRRRHLLPAGIGHMASVHDAECLCRFETSPRRRSRELDSKLTRRRREKRTKQARNRTCARNTVAMIRVLVLPPRDSCSSRVSLLSLPAAARPRSANKHSELH
jgi:hypothetical protein